MRTLLRFVWRELLRAKGRFAIIALILTFQAAALGGGYLAQEALYFTRDTWSEKLRLADLEVQVVAASREEMPSLEALRAIPGVSAVSRRFVTLGYLEKSSGAPLPVVVQYLDPSAHPPVNDIELREGRWLQPGEPDLAIVDRAFAAAHSIKVGDEIVLNPRRLSSRFKIVGVGLSAEYLVPTANPQLLVPHKGSLGVVYASREALDRTFPDELYNDIVLTFSPDADARATTEAVLAALGGLQVERVVKKQETFGHRFIDVLLSGSRSVTPTIALLVALMASIVAFISVHRVVAERRREIGCLLAQGFSAAQLAACFFLIGLVPGVLGGLAGIPSALLFGRAVARTTARITGFPEPLMPFCPGWLALAAGCSVVVGVLSALPTTVGVLRLRPSHALRGGGEIRFVGLPSFLERLLAGSTSVRYAVRNVFRRVRLALATAALVALAVALPAGLLTSISSWETWAEDQASRLRWDAVVSFKVPLEPAQVDDVLADKGIAAWDGYIQGYASVRRADGLVEEMRVRGLPVKSDLVTKGITAGRSFSDDHAAEALLNSAFAGNRPPRVGEIVTLVRRGVRHDLVVVGVVTEASLSTIFVPRGTAQRIFGLEGKVSGAYVRYGTAPGRSKAEGTAPPAATASAKPVSTAEVLERIDIDETTASALPAGVESAAVPEVGPPEPRDTKCQLLDEELVTSVQVRTEYARATVDYLAAFNIIVVPFVALGGGLAFLFLLGVLGFLLVERETEYATLRSMGYGGAEISRIVLTEVGVLATAGLVLSVGTWAATAYALRVPMAAAWFCVPLDLRAADLSMCCVPTLLFLGLAAAPGIRALVRLDLSAALRGRALG
jgi:putative ABC transport system permease protein